MGSLNKHQQYLAGGLGGCLMLFDLAGCWFLIAGRWLLVVGWWLLLLLLLLVVVID